MSKIVVVVATAAAALLVSQSTAYAPPAPRVQILENGADRIGIRNSDGEWWIAKRCLGTPGPGYVYLVKRDGKIVVDDEGEPILDDPNGGLNPYGSSGGLGSFGYQHARGIPPFEFGRRGGSNTWWVSSRVCSGNHPQNQGLFGVSSRCAQPTCGDAPHHHFAKEPKFTMQVVPAAGDTLAVYDEAGTELTRWLGGHPRRGTGQVGQDARDSVVFTASGLKVVARGVSGRWEGSGSGLDEWAVSASGYAPAPSELDGPAPVHYASGQDTRWDCNAGSPDGDGVRQWELVGGAPGYPLAAFFHGWEGGVGHNHCEPVARHLPPPSAVFENYFEYTIASDSGGRTGQLAP